MIFICTTTGYVYNVSLLLYPLKKNLLRYGMYVYLLFICAVPGSIPHCLDETP